MRNPFPALAEKLLTRKADRRAIEDAHADIEQAKSTADADADLLRETYDLAARYREHRESNHFEQRMRAAYRGERHA